MIRKFLLFFFIVVLTSSFQDKELKLFKSIPTRASYFTTDNLGNCYIIKDDVIEKYDSIGKLSKTFSNKLLGKISLVDASNPLKLLLFYKDFSQLLLLDNMLSPSADPVLLSDLGFEQAQLVCSSINNGFWLYNQQNFELVRVDQNLQVTQKTGNITQLTGLAVNPNYLIEYNNKVYLNNPLTGILVFDIYGTYYKNIPIKNLASFQIKEENILYYSNNKLMSFNMKTLNQETFTIPDSSAIAVRSEKDHLFLLKKNNLDIYVNK